MQLTRVQRRNLELYRQYRATPPTLGGLLRANARGYAVIAAITILAFIMLTLLEEVGVRWLLIGVATGALARDIGTFRRFIAVWPVTERVLDWQQIDVLLAE